MIPYSVVLVLVLGAHLVHFSDGQSNYGYGGGTIDWYAVLNLKGNLQDGYFNYYDCTLKCFANVFQLSYIYGNFCNKTFQLYSQDWSPVAFQKVVQVVECITVQCPAVVDKSVCDSRYDYPNGQYVPGSPNYPNYQPPAAGDLLNAPNQPDSPISGTNPLGAAQNIPGVGLDQLSQNGTKQNYDSDWTFPFTMPDKMQQHLIKWGYDVFATGTPTDTTTDSTTTSTTESTTSTTTESTTPASTTTESSTTSTTESSTTSTTESSTTSTTESSTTSTTPSSTTSTTDSTTDDSTTDSSTASSTYVDYLFPDTLDVSKDNSKYSPNSGYNLGSPNFDDNGYPLNGFSGNYPDNGYKLGDSPGYYPDNGYSLGGSRGNYPDNAYALGGSPGNYPGNGYSLGNYPDNGYPLGGSPDNGYPLGGYPDNGYPLAGSPGNGVPLGSSPGNGVPLGGSPGNGDPLGGSPGNGVPLGGSPGNGIPLGGSPGNGYPLGGYPDNGYPLAGSPGNGVPLGSSPGNGVPLGGSPGNGVPLGGSPGNGVPLGGSPGDYLYNNYNYPGYGSYINYQQYPYYSYINPNQYTPNQVNIPGYQNQATGAQDGNLGQFNLNNNLNGQSQITSITKGIKKPDTENNLKNKKGVNQIPVNPGASGSNSFAFATSGSQVNQGTSNAGVPNSNSVSFANSASQITGAPNGSGVPGSNAYSFANAASQGNQAPTNTGVPNSSSFALAESASQTNLGPSNGGAPGFVPFPFGNGASQIYGAPTGLGGGGSFSSAYAASQGNQAPSYLGGGAVSNSYSFANRAPGFNIAPANYAALGPNYNANQAFENQPLNSQGLQGYQLIPTNSFTQQNILQNGNTWPDATPLNSLSGANQNSANPAPNNNSKNPKDDVFRIEYNDETFTLNNDGSISVYKNGKLVRTLKPFK